ncbi:DUF2155 domain-containing protein [Caulobacter vibrioides]|uniref:DUF2155 domain-containing protein n=1 Tax=Caulobacter vibrioides TaxID=155892 RepID=UPI000BB4C037|nr:DUF2155 domain-containing protein [Caulobacter vibrioides]ATC24853.1 DUF2155 domain-containing protein [Caulobacter vibrioides]AZH13012.1 DUF2155 domain-containing protein [Caulobacter vibrioides]PLR09630.1 DUF2155 domain-containing protein [Caulobacter vibrioides]
MARRASLIAAVSVLSGLAVAGVAVARQAGTPQAQTPPAAPAATPAPPAPVGELRPAQPVQVAPATANPNPPASPAPGAATQVKPPAATKPAEPAKRARYSVAILQALDKVTTETMRFEVPIGQPIRYKTLIFTVRACETAAADEVAPESAAYVVVDTQPKAQAGRAAPPGRQIYKGWMYASSPGLNPLQHPVYDAWLIACKQSIPVAPAAKP